MSKRELEDSKVSESKRVCQPTCLADTLDTSDHDLYPGLKEGYTQEPEKSSLIDVTQDDLVYVPFLLCKAGSFYVRKNGELIMLDDNDIELVMGQTKKSRDDAIQALIENGGDIVNSIMSLISNVDPVKISVELEDMPELEDTLGLGHLYPEDYQPTGGFYFGNEQYSFACGTHNTVICKCSPNCPGHVSC